MASSTLLDTRTSARSSLTHGQSTNYSSQTQTPGSVGFRHLTQQMIVSAHQQRHALRKVVIERLRLSRDPISYIGVLLDQCVIEHRNEGIEIAIDVLSRFGVHVIEFAKLFLTKDVKRWKLSATPSRHHVHDDIWYVLLRATGLSNLDDWQKIPMLGYFVMAGTPSIRESSVRALADVGSPIAIRLIGRVGNTDSSKMVRDAAGEVLADLEG
jgi:hypothetical protein